MRIEEFNYTLPEGHIAQHPVYPRDHAKLMVLHKDSRKISHLKFFEIERFFKEGDVLVLNNTKVIRARIKGFNEETKGKREIFLLKQIEDYKWRALTRPNKRIHVGDRIIIDAESGIYATVTSKGEDGENIVEFFSDKNLSMRKILGRIGDVPLPPYIKGKITDEDEYQTVFAKEEGAVASPTAGLHFTKELLGKLQKKGVKIAYVTLHVGLGTFKPVKEEIIEHHKMHEEEFFVPEETVAIINNARISGGRVFACGTTVVRTLETASTAKGILKPLAGKTRLFIKPGYPFKITDAIITNFHFPKTTLLMLVAAFAGKDFIIDAYRIAVRENYRFYSFGDAMLII
jgi:S-adenosylmethionine:tRNA ribosyltransferase-isomerase